MLLRSNKYQEGGGGSAQAKTHITPYTTPQTIYPDQGYDYLSSVQIDEITYVEEDNAAGGTTAIIGAIAPN